MRPSTFSRRFFAGVILLSAFSGLTARAEANDDTRSPVHQLRIYEIFENNKAAFHERFRDHAARIMAKYGFKIVSMWESKFADRTEFVYLLEWPDEQTMKSRWAAFMADEEWKRIKKETGAKHGQFVGDIEDRMLRLTEYSPQRELLR
jgi:hypothetical protein